MRAFFRIYPSGFQQKYSRQQGAVFPVKRPFATLIVAICLVFSHLSFASASSIDQLKLAYLYKILAFVSIPQATGSQIVVVVVGGEAFGADPFTLAGKKVGGKSIVIRPYQSRADLATCQVIFIASGTPATVADILEVVVGRGCLTVGDTPGFVDQGGMIGFVSREGKLLFEVNQTVLRQQGLQVNSNLLEVACRVIR